MPVKNRENNPFWRFERGTTLPTVTRVTLSNLSMVCGWKIYIHLWFSAGTFFAFLIRDELTLRSLKGASMGTLIPAERVEGMIRGRRVILDADLAGLYGVPTKRLNEQVKRNMERFPADFMFRLNPAEVMESNRSQFATGSRKHRDPRFPPFVFTEHGAIMAATVLNTRHAVQVSVYVVRAFIRLRQTLAAHRELADKLAQFERRVGTHDDAIRDLMTAIRHLMDPPPEKPRERIGFRP